MLRTSSGVSALASNVDRIAQIETLPVLPRWLFVRVETEQGAVGWGEATLEGHAEAVSGAIDAARDCLIGHDASRIEDAWQMLHRGGFYRGGPVFLSAIAGIDQALWDLTGRKLGVPVHQLIGGRVRDRISVYAWIGGDCPHDVAAGAAERKAQGFTAVKMNAVEDAGWIGENKQIDGLVERLRVVRETGMEVGVDFHGRIHKPVARKALRAIEPLQPLFAEEVLLGEQPKAIEQLAQQTTVPLAMGERLFSRWDFRPYLESGALDLVQPDLSHAGGISECRRIAAMAETYDVGMAPHSPIGPIALAACLQLAAATPNFVIQEMSLGIHYNSASEDLLSLMLNPEMFSINDGAVAVPDGPGLGIEINEEAVRKMAKTPHRWRTPLWRGRDGELREW